MTVLYTAYTFIKNMSNHVATDNACTNSITSAGTTNTGNDEQFNH